jgi:hypothetical protein
MSQQDHPSRRGRCQWGHMTFIVKSGVEACPKCDAMHYWPSMADHVANAFGLEAQKQLRERPYDWQTEEEE